MENMDYYKILGISKTATSDEIKKAYRKLARKYHPDLHPNDKTAEKKFKEINEANEVLSNAESRAKFDKYGKDWKHADEFEKASRQQQSQGRRPQGQQYSSQQEGDYSDFFESMFGRAGGGGGGRTQSFKGQDFTAEMHLGLKDVYTTHKRTLTVNGKNIRLTIPAGVTDGQMIRIKGQGGPGMNGGPNGDLILQFAIANATSFKRDGNNLYKTVELDLYEAILGGEITVDTFDGKVKLKIAPETQNGTKVKLKGKGFPVYKKEGVFGDLLLTYEIKMPQNISEKERELFVELSKIRKS